jgi:hypothetical protein
MRKLPHLAVAGRLAYGIAAGADMPAELTFGNMLTADLPLIRRPATFSRAA